MEDPTAVSNNLNGCHAVSARVPSCKQQRWTLNGVSKKVNYRVADKICGKARESGLENEQEQGRFSNSQDLIPDHPTKPVY